MTITDWLEQQRKLLEAATKGPQGKYRSSSNKYTIKAEDDYVAECYDGEFECNSDFIASVRTEHERALMIIEKYRGAIEDILSGEPTDENGEYSIINQSQFLRAQEALAYFPEMDE